MVLQASVVVRSYSDLRWDDLVRCIESLQTQSVPPTEIVLVIDHNAPLMERAARQFPDAVVVPNRYDMGSSHAWNTGIETATSEIIAFIDDDAVAAPNWLEQLLAHYKAPDVVGVGGDIQPNWHGGRPLWFPHEFDWVVGCSYEGLPETVAPVRNLIGCNMSFRRQPLHDIGLFLTDKGLGHKAGRPIGCDETELCIRLHQANTAAVLLHNPQAVVYHTVPAPRATWRYFRSRCLLEGQSKATVARLAGPRQGLATERHYTFRTLPLGVLRGVGDALWGREWNGVRRSSAIVAGLAYTVLGYVKGAVWHRAG